MESWCLNLFVKLDLLSFTNLERTNTFAGGHFLNKKYQQLSTVVDNIFDAIASKTP